jgi:hypothetical protein
MMPQGFVEGNSLQIQPRKVLAQPEELFHAPLVLLLSLESRSLEGQSGNFTIDDDKVHLAIAVQGRDPQRLVELLLEVARKHADVLPAPSPEALLVGMSRESIRLSLRFWTVVGARNINRLKSHLRLQILTALKWHEIGENSRLCASAAKPQG